MLSTDLAQYKHDIERFVSKLSTLSGIRDHEKNDSGLMFGRLKTINSIALALSAKTSFLRYCDLRESCEDVEIQNHIMSFVPSMERISYAGRALNQMHHNFSSKEPVKLKRHTHKKFCGPDFFEFIPFAILDNAIKYKMRDSVVEIELFDSTDKCIADFSSFGPMIDEDERENIFNNEYRGRHTTKTGIAGGGIGLYHARRAVEEAFNGRLFYKENAGSSPFTIDGTVYQYHTFRLEIPSYEPY